MSKDIYDDLLKFGSSFDWITPLCDIVEGYNNIEVDETMAFDYCKQKEKELKAQGIKCRTQFMGEGWRVISKR